MTLSAKTSCDKEYNGTWFFKIGAITTELWPLLKIVIISYEIHFYTTTGYFALCRYYVGFLQIGSQLSNSDQGMTHSRHHIIEYNEVISCSHNYHML